MQQWEYMLVMCDKNKVAMVNGDKVKGELIWDYLNLRGSEGWEVVATTTNQYNSTESAAYTLKRLISQKTLP